MAEDGRIKSFLASLLKADPAISSGRLRDLCIAEFGSDITIVPPVVPRVIRMPPARTFRHFVASMRGKANVE